MNDNVNYPAHYTQIKEKLGVECIQVIEALELNFALGSVMKYIWRHPKKNGLEDLKKARFYLDSEIARREAAEKVVHEDEEMAQAINDPVPEAVAQLDWRDSAISNQLPFDLRQNR